MMSTKSDNAWYVTIRVIEERAKRHATLTQKLSSHELTVENVRIEKILANCLDALKEGGR